MMKCSPKHYMFMFIILIVIHVSGYQSVKKGELMTKVPRSCKKLPQLTKRCMNGKGQSSKNCKKLPTITKKCQRLSESWQLLAETLKKVAKKGGETVAPKEEESYENYEEGSGSGQGPLPLAIIVSGGNEAAGKSVEVLHMDGSPWCSLPDLPEACSSHTQTGLEACGGSGLGVTCVTFKRDPFTGATYWDKTNKLKKWRIAHASWASPEGTVLMGGANGGDTTELLEKSEYSQLRSATHFPLKYWTE